MAGPGRNYLIQVNAFVSFTVNAQSGPRENRHALKGLHEPCFTRNPAMDSTLMQQFRCRTCTEIVPPSELIKGFPLDKGFVPLTDAEIKAQVSTASDVITVQGLIPMAEIETLRLDSARFLGPQMPSKKKGISASQTKTFELFRQGLINAERAAVVTWVDSGHDKLGLIVPQEPGCLLYECFFDDEMPAITDQFKAETFAPITLTQEELGFGALVLQQLFVDAIDWSQYSDGFYHRVDALARAKAEGREIVATVAPPPPAETTDLLAALKASLAAGAVAAPPPAAVNGGKAKASKKVAA